MWGWWGGHMRGRPEHAAKEGSMSNGLIGGTRNAAALRVSFEFFPPKTEAMEQQLWQAVKRLEPLGPPFVAGAYGAGGSTPQPPPAPRRPIQAATGPPPAAPPDLLDAP